MARNDWDVGRREGWKPSSALDNLERILGLTSKIGQGVKAARETRGQALSKDMLLVVGQNGKNYKRLINADDVRALKTQLQSLEPKIKNSDVDTMGTFQFFKDDIEN